MYMQKKSCGLEGGKVIVGIDENGVPNEKSASILGQYLGQTTKKPSLAPLHIERWDNPLFNTHKQQIIKDVEVKLILPVQAKRSLDEIINWKPNNVNELQWKALAGFWYREPHKVPSFYVTFISNLKAMSVTNSRIAKEQKNTHTSGRKSHARLKKRWQLNNNGNLLAQDFNEVFGEIVAKELKARGYYDDNYWSEVLVSQGVTFVTQTGEERRYQEKVNAMENKVQHMGGFMKHWLGFMLKKFPEEDFIK
uniref:Uncharacterized protein n=1 Tax=Setaria italica TaxID=4555 RepID=K3ZL50_SETIT